MIFADIVLAVVGFVVTLLVMFFYIMAIAFTLWMAIDAGKQDRFWWLTCVIGVPIIGPVAYYFTEKKHEYAKAVSHRVHVSETEEQHEITPKKHNHKEIIKETSQEESPVLKGNTTENTEKIV